ncbi:NUDIX domain-containing protein [Burkholderia sp. Ac-20353]|uniref:NUDIX hydrolase n=1 Tax=Burkholderia sp. Ac-20353 TaxID=2703894 RepID=UPI00197BEDD5|nr:NUDIX domain-containing protein [Burkholderia sp. Ac-20353]MBN3788084.1 NUDIX domain-containing protein [Burkholderia sp. Ac-20353]
MDVKPEHDLTDATKACPILLRNHQGTTEILAFEHPSAGYQLVKGSIERGESAKDAAVRELREESGIRDAEVISDLGSWNAPYQGQIWSFQLCATRTTLPDEWTFETTDDGGHVFRLFWHPMHSSLPDPCHVLFREALREVRRRIPKEILDTLSTLPDGR